MIGAKTQFTRERVTVDCSKGKIRTEQHHANATNINKIVAKMRKGGLVPMSTSQELVGDFTSAEDYFATRNSLMEAQKKFMSLPASIRQRFKNNPMELIGFLNSEENRAEAEKLGLVSPRVQPPKTDAETAAPQENQKT